VVKHSFLVKQTEDIPGVLKKAFWLAASGRPGPVVVDLPKDILNPANKLPYVWPESVSMRSYNPTTQGIKGRSNVRCRRWWRRKTGCLCRRRGDQCCL
jgi:acetolactate synthase-1/2/3 large subunit